MILIVDDEVDICWSLQHIFNNAGFPTTTSTNARDALELLNNQMFSFVFIDAMLPDIDGLDLANSIRQADCNVNIVMISGYYYEADISVQQAINRGIVNAFISKPFLQEEIICILKKLNPEAFDAAIAKLE
ncbi:response regulator [Solidesulfovibrio sp. C21]|uniref:response regulator n=1 Tax=Solidesulfovibrio sp. C21 TaxID=3398613 RepID=UPI0039FBCC26